MKKSFYQKLALMGISKNRKIYLPYIITSIGMVMMSYIVLFLGLSDTVEKLRGGSTISLTLRWGSVVIFIFSIILLFYTNSFLMKRRKKEFGLYNILGMDKGNISKILIWENVIIFAVSTVSGLTLGMLFSKLAELLLVRMLKGKASFNFFINPLGLLIAAAAFALIFVLLILKTLFDLRKLNPTELLKSEAQGEKQPAGNKILAILGVIVLAVAYAIALSKQDPMTTMLLFVIAVVLVIIATYLLMISGSVALCKRLQKNKKYYYKANHFVSTSSMVYRMKRNGAGLASICILCTMVLVMLSSTSCLFSGIEQRIEARNPRDIEVAATGNVNFEFLSDCVDAALGEKGCSKENVVKYNYATFAGDLVNDRFNFQIKGRGEAVYLFILPISAYNLSTGKNETLKPDEVIICSKSKSYQNPEISIGDKNTYKVKKTVTDYQSAKVDSQTELMTISVFVHDESAVAELIEFIKKNDIAYNSINYRSGLSYVYAFDTDASNLNNEEQLNLVGNISLHIVNADNKDQYGLTGEGGTRLQVNSKIEDSEMFYGTNAGLFVLGILLSIVFLFGTVLIIYYKQIIEGYEDRARFDIMQRVGMTDKEIKKSISSQILTVFFAPVLFAGLHMAFAFKPIAKILTEFSVTDTKLLILTTLICFAVFALFYAAVYLITSKAYYRIVKGKNTD